VIQGAAKRAALKAREIKKEKAREQKVEDDGNNTDADQFSLPADDAVPGGSGLVRKTSRPVGGGATRKPSSDSVASTRSEIPVIKISEEEESAKAGTSGTAVKPIVVPSKKQRVLKALIKAGKVRITFS
jgi:hypothetical protein